MASHSSFATGARARPADTESSQRIRAEYREMPGLCLTTEQAMRLWTLDRPTCEAALETLIRAGVLERDDRGPIRAQPLDGRLRAAVQRGSGQSGVGIYSHGADSFPLISSAGLRDLLKPHRDRSSRSRTTRSDN